MQFFALKGFSYSVHNITAIFCVFHFLLYTIQFLMNVTQFLTFLTITFYKILLLFCFENSFYFPEKLKVRGIQIFFKLFIYTIRKILLYF